MREDNKQFHALVLPISHSKYVLHQVNDAFIHNSTARNYQCLIPLYFWKGLCKDVDIHVKQWIKCRQQNLYPQYYA